MLVGHRPPSPHLGYVDQIVGEGASDIDFLFFNGPLKRDDVDVVHVHDLDGLLGGPGATGTQRLENARAVAKHLRRHRISLVRTVTGDAEQAGDGWADRMATRILDRATTAFVVFDEATRTPDPARTTVIPFAHPGERFLGFPRTEQVPGRLLCISPTFLEPRAAGALKVFSVTDTPGLSLRIVGEVSSEFETLIPRVAARRPDDISTRIERISDGAMVMEISAAELVILPRIETLDDLTVLFTALSLDRPVLVPETGPLRRQADEVGPGWVHLHAGPLTAQLVDETIARLRDADRVGPVDLERRHPDAVAAKYAALYGDAAHRKTIRIQ